MGAETQGRRPGDRTDLRRGRCGRLRGPGGLQRRPDGAFPGVAIPNGSLGDSLRESHTAPFLQLADLVPLTAPKSSADVQMMRVRELQPGLQGRVGRIRRDSAARLLPAAPVITTSTASELVWRSFQATSLAMERLVEAGVLVQVSIGRATAPSRPMIWSTRSRRLSAGSRVRRAIPAYRPQRAGCLADRQGIGHEVGTPRVLLNLTAGNSRHLRSAAASRDAVA